MVYKPFAIIQISLLTLNILLLHTLWKSDFSMEKYIVCLVSMICIFCMIDDGFSLTAVKKQSQLSGFGFGDEAMDPGVVDYVCQHFCSEDKTEEDQANFAQILLEVNIIKDQVNSLIEAVKATPKTSVVPLEYRKAYPVVLAKSDHGNYKLTLNQARAVCQEQGSKLATHAQLVAAFEQGMDFCSCGWLDEGYAAFPIQYPRDGCFASQNNNGPGVRTSCTWQSTWNAWCFNKEEANKHHSN